MEFTQLSDETLTANETTDRTNSLEDDRCHHLQQQRQSNVSRYSENFYRELIKTDTILQQSCSALVTDLLAGDLTFLDCVQSLENLLLSDDILIRGGALKIVTSILDSLPTNFLNDQTIKELTLFLCGRLDDHHSFIPTILKALLLLVEMENMPDGVCVDIFRTLNDQFSPHSQLAADKLTCYRILNVMMSKKSDELRTLGAEFVEGYLNLIEGERDPRNLIFIFEHLPSLFKNFPLYHLTEEAFETVANYFPIDFQSGARSEITRTDLSNALSPCLTAIDDFCPFAVPLILDKLSSSLRVARIDSFQLLIRCFEQFTPDKLCSFVDEINSELLNILKPTEMDSDLHELCLMTFAKFIAYLSSHNRITELQNVLNTILSKFEHFLNDLSGPHYLFALTFLSRISSSCSSAASFILIKVLPNLFRLNRQSPLSNANLLLSLKLLLHPCVIFKIDCSSIEELRSTWDQLPLLLVKFCSDTNEELRILAFESASSIVQLFNSQQRCDLYVVLCENIKNDNNVNTRTKCAKCLRTIAEVYRDEVSIQLNERLKSIERNSFDDVEMVRRIFHCWCIVSPVNGLLHFLRDSIEKYIISGCSRHESFVIESLKYLLMAEKSNSEFVGKLHHEANLLWHLMDWWQQGCNAICDDTNQIFDDETVADNLQLIIALIMRSLDTSSQLEITNRYFQLEIDHSKRFSKSFQYLKANDVLDSPKVHCSLSIITLEGVVAAILPQVLTESFQADLATVVEYLTTLSLYCSRSHCCLAACRCLATITNKIEKDLEKKKFADHVRLRIIEAVAEGDLMLKTNAATLLIFVTKGLLCSGFLELNLWFDLLLSLIVNDNVGDLVADGFRIIVDENVYFMSNFCHCIVRLFYRQRLFSYIVPKLANLTRTNSEKSVRIRCAQSIIHLLKNTPPSVVSIHLKEILHSTIEILKPNVDQQLLCQLLNALSPLIVNNGTIFEDNIGMFVTKSLLIACEAPNLKSRIAALECLHELSKLNHIVILRYQRQIIHELKKCLDDKKRLVRRKATRTRTRWEIIGTPP